jgi:hypothetical protein
MFMLKWTALAGLTTALTLANETRAQRAADFAGVEVAAARAILASRTATGAVAIDPAFAVAGHAPGVSTTNLRPAQRMETLLRSVGIEARSSSLDRVRECAPPVPCRIQGVGSYLLLSEPQVEGDSALVSVTLIENSKSRSVRANYETSLVRLVRSGSNWAVVSIKPLGAS